MDDLLSEFLTETNESLSELDGDIVRLEQNPNDQGLLGNIFRLVHTIKGTCGFLGLPRLESVAHAGENVLGRVRDGELAVNTGVVTIILECLDRIREILDALEQTEQEPDGDDSDLISRLNVVAEGDAEEGTSVESADEAKAEGPDTVGIDELEAAFMAAKGPEELEAERQVLEESVAEVDETPAATAPVATAEPVASQQAEPGDGETRKDSIANQSLRVNVEVLEDLMTMVSELVLTRNQLLQISRGQEESEFGAPLQRLNYVVSELQEGVMATRMQPIGNAWAKLPRIIRDLSQELGKRIELVMRGAETELDRQVLEMIKDPLIHMVRNSADHGLEIPEERIKTGKPEQGSVTLNAYHEGGHIIIEISDDGRGLSIEKIKAKILANGLASESEIESLSEQQIQQYIFRAGFSTVEKVTAVSGRGVGMDVVRTNIEKIGGTIELTSVEGKGSRFTIKIPLTLAIVSALIVECAGERFAIPQLSVVELVRASANSEHRIEHINETPVLRLRNRLLPLTSLRDLLRLDDLPPAMVDPDEPHDEADESEQPMERKGEDFIVVAKIGAYSMGIIVDRVFDTEEIVVKPVAPILRDQQLFSGNTILGDGSVVMILDPNGIASATGELSVADDDSADVEKRSAEVGELTSMLVFRAVDEAPKAVPLNLIARLEEIDLAKIEHSNGQHMVQYRGQLVPLVCMEDKKEFGGEGRQPVLIFTDGERTMGLVVDEIVDIVEDHLKIELTSDQDDCMGTAIIDGKATDIIDASYYLTQAYPDWFEGSGQEQRNAQETRLLLIDDSPFFRNLLQPLLSISGYEVVCVESAAKALELCDAGENFDVIISDIEMPGMNGFDFAEKVKEDTNWRSIPLVALSSYANARDLERGRKAGFNDYVSKTDRDALLQTLMEAVSQSRGAA